MMLTKAEALELVSRQLEAMSPADEFVVIEGKTEERGFGWVVFYNSRKFVETGESRYRLAGNGPVIVNKHDASVEFFGAARPVSEVIEEYEKRLSREKRRMI